MESSQPFTDPMLLPSFGPDPGVGLSPKLQELQSAIQASFSEANTEKRKTSENFMANFLQNDPEALQCLITLIAINTSHGVKQSAVIWVTKIIDEILLHTSISAELKLYKIGLLIKALMTEDMEHSLRRMLQHSIRSILKTEISNGQTENDITTFILKVVEKELDKDISSVPARKGMITGALMLVFLLQDACLSGEDIKNLYLNLMPRILRNGFQFLESLSDDLQKFGEIDPLSHLYPFFIKEAYTKAIVVDETMSLLIGFVGRMTVVKDILISRLLLQEELLSFLQSGWLLSVRSQSQPPDCLLILSGEQSLDRAVNGIKAKVMMTCDRLLKLIETCSMEACSSLFFIPSMTNLIQFAIRSLLGVTGEPIIDKIFSKIETFCLSEAITYSMSFISHACTYFKEFFDVISNAREVLIAQVIPPLIATSPEEYETYELSPIEFLNLNLDVSDNQRSKIIKTEAGRLLETICTYLDGATSMLGNYALNILAFTLNGKEDLSVIPIEHPQLASFLGHCVLSSSPQTRVDISLMMLTCYAYKLNERKDIIKSIEHIFSMHGNVLVQLSDFLKCKLCLFLRYLIEHIFKEPSQSMHFLHFFGFILQCCEESPDRSRTLNTVALEVAQNVMDDDNLRARLEPFVPSVLQSLFGGIKSSSNPSFFSLLSTILAIFDGQIAENELLFHSILQHVTERLNEELKNESLDNFVVANRLFIVLRGICDNLKFVRKQRELIESEISGLFSLLNNPAKYGNFDEDLFLMATSLVRKSQTLTVCSPLVFPFIVGSLERGHYSLGFIYELINSFCFYGKGTLKDKGEIVGIFIDVATATLKFFDQKENIELFQMEAALIFQSVVENFMEVMPLEKLLFIFNVTLERLNDKAHPIRREFLFCSLIQIFLMGFLCGFTQTSGVLQQIGQLSNVLQLVFQNRLVYAQIYDKKLAVLSLCNIVMNNDGSFNPFLPAVFELSSFLLKAQEVKESLEGIKKIQDEDPRKLRDISLNNSRESLYRAYEELLDQEKGDLLEEKKNRKGLGLFEENLRTNEDIFEEDEFLLEEGSRLNVKNPFRLLNGNQKQIAAKNSLDLFETGVKKQDEFDAFRSVVSKIKLQNPELLLMTIGQMSPKGQKNFSEIISKQRVITESGTCAPRKILRVREKPIQALN